MAIVLHTRAGRRSRGSIGVLMASVLVAFVLVAALRSHPADPAIRLPGRYRLVDLIQHQTVSARSLRHEVTRLRAEVDAVRSAVVSQTGEAKAQQSEIDEEAELAGLTPLVGEGLRVTLDDSTQDEPPSGGSVNDLVIHSQDVQAVVNALWRAGAEAVAINGQRLVSTSAVLCVGNTLLLNGTVHSPPYVISAVSAARDRFESDRLVRRLRSNASTFGLDFSIERQSSLEIPAYRGSTRIIYARPVA